MSAVPQLDTTETNFRDLRPTPPVDEERRQFLEEIVDGTRESYRRGVVKECRGDDREARQALLRLLLHVDRYLNVLRARKFYSSGRRGYTGLLAGLTAAAFHHHRWIRPVEDWACEPSVNGTLRQIDHFASLLRHLFARYDIPLSWTAPSSRGWTRRVWSSRSGSSISPAEAVSARSTHRSS